MILKSDGFQYMISKYDSKKKKEKAPALKLRKFVDKWLSQSN
jgi:hypothetical protein